MYETFDGCPSTKTFTYLLFPQKQTPKREFLKNRQTNAPPPHPLPGSFVQGVGESLRFIPVSHFQVCPGGDWQE